MDHSAKPRAGLPTRGPATDDSKKSPAWKAVLLASMCLYVAALCLPGANAKGEEPIGLVFLFYGAFGFTIGEFRWLANVFYFTGLVFAGAKRAHRSSAIVCLAVAVGLAASCIPIPPRMVVGAEDVSAVIAQLSIGGYLWILAQVIALALPFMPSKPAARGQQARNAKE